MEVPRAFDLGRDRRVPILKFQLLKETFLEMELADHDRRLINSLTDWAYRQDHCCLNAPGNGWEPL